MLKTILIFAAIAGFYDNHRGYPENQGTHTQNAYVYRLSALDIQVPRTSENQATANEQEGKDGNKIVVTQMPEKDAYDKAALFVNGGLFIVGLGGILIAFLTFKGLSNSSERQLRAYVVVETGNIVNIANPPPMIGDYTPQPGKNYSSRVGSSRSCADKEYGPNPRLRSPTLGKYFLRGIPPEIYSSAKIFRDHGI
jgi:hypothetical protein